MKLLLLFSISAVLSAPFYDVNDKELDHAQNISPSDNYEDHDYGSDSEFVDYDSDDSDLEIPGLNFYVDLNPCNSDNMLSVSSLELRPDPPKTGQNLTLVATGYLSSPILRGATLRITAKLGLITLYDQTDNLCDIARENGLQCPIGIGEHSIVGGFAVPAIAPHVSIGFP